MINEASPLLQKQQESKRVELDERSKIAQRKLKLACLCSMLFMVAEIVGGFFAGSLAIMTDAAHLLSDVAGFLISLFAIWIGTLPASSRMSYGFSRAEVIGAIVSVLFIWVLTGVLVYAAIERLREDLGPNPQQRVDGKLMFLVALVGLFVNLLLMQILGHNHGGGHGHSHGGGGHGHSHGHSHKGGNEEGGGHGHNHGGTALTMHAHLEKDEEKGGEEEGEHDRHDQHHDAHHHKQHQHHENINVQAAYIHALGDFVQSIGVCIAGALIWYDPKWQMADPIATFLFSILVLATTIGVVKRSVHVLMEGTPDGIDAEEIEEGLRALPSIITTHDLHIWSLTVGMPSLSVHLLAEDADAALHEAQTYLISKGIDHTTIQVENVQRKYPKDCTDNQCGRNSPRK